MRSRNQNIKLVQFKSHMSIIEASQLRIHQKIDHRDTEGRFIKAAIIDKKKSNLKIHYFGWDSEWDVWSDYKKELFRFANYKSISERPQHRFLRLQKGDNIQMNPMNKGWKVCEIIGFDLGQIEVVYNTPKINCHFWSHIDNQNEVVILPTALHTNVVNERSKRVL